MNYNGNGNTNTDVAMPSSTHTYDLTKTLSPNRYVREYSVDFKSEDVPIASPLTAKAQFLGWAESETSDVKYTDREPVVNLCSDAGGTIILYAQWELGEITLPELSREGYTMLGWFTAANGGGSKVGMPGDKYTPNGNTTLYVQWEKNTYTITLDARGGLPPIKTVNIRYDDEVGTVLFNGTTATSQPKSELIPIYLGYDFKGWKDSDGHEVKGDTKYTYAGDSTYYAEWDRSKIIITFKRGAESTSEPGGTVIHTVAKTKPYAPKIDMLFSLRDLYHSIAEDSAINPKPTLEPTAPGKNFLGWARSPSSPDPECGGQSKPNIVSFS